jgi:monoamine oxidase
MPDVRPTRRRLLTMAAAGLLLSRPTRAQGLGKTAVVIGAGIAGLSAAQILSAEFATPIVLDARDRVGGRIVTDRGWADCPADLGASWIHGLDENPLTEIARDARLRFVRTPLTSGVYRHADGREFTAAEETALDDLVSALDEMMDGSCADPKQDFLAAARAAHGDLFAAAGPLSRLALFEAVEGDWGSDAAALSACRLGDDLVLGGEDVMLKDGFDLIVRHLTMNLDVRLGVTATGVKLTPDGARVETSAGPINCDFVVVTVPLPVLKRGGIVFDPPLPDSHAGPIDRIGEGVLAKTFLRFPEAFWDDSLFIGRAAPETDGFFDFMNLDRVQKAPVLLSFASGSFGREVEGMADADLLALLGENVRGLYGSSARLPTELRRWAWSKDPLAGMAYSAPHLGLKAGDREALAAVIDGRLVFAGEAVHAAYPGTAHGASLSGIAAAQALVRG